MTNLVKPSEILTDALKNLETYGWTQGDFGSATKGYCSVGATSAATEARTNALFDWLDKSRFWRVHEHAIHYLHVATGECGIPYWNDDPHRTYEDVILAFKRAIELAEADER